MSLFLRLMTLAGACCLNLMAMADSAVPASYGFPIGNPFEATIAGTPAELRPALPSDEDIDQGDYSLNLLPQREARLPSNFWPVKRLSYRLARQAGPAPLIFIIAGTGGHYSGGKMEFLKRLYYGAGYHVVQLSSPTSYDFIAAASRHATPGFSVEDAKDLYRAMVAIREQQEHLKITEFYLTGFSLGGLDAAFVSHLDEQERVFNFKRVLLINPPVNLYTSVSNLQLLVQSEVPAVRNQGSFFELLLGKLTHYFQDKGHIQMDDALLYDFQESKERLSNEEMAMLIGSSFRFTASDIAFTSDLINQRGFITPPHYPIDDGTNLTPFYKRALLCDFDCYLSEQLIPFWREKYDGSGLQMLIQQTSLYALEDYLRQSPKIAVMHNADDLILGPGDLGFLKRTFGERLTLYPRGGHLGNMDYRDNSQAMLEFFRG